MGKKQSSKTSEGIAQQFLQNRGTKIKFYDELHSRGRVDRPGDLIAVVDSNNSFYTFFLSPEAKFMEGFKHVYAIDFLVISGDMHTSIKNGAQLRLASEVWRPHNGSLSERYMLKEKHLENGVYKVSDSKLIEKTLNLQVDNSGLPNFLVPVYEKYFSKDEGDK